LFAGWVRKAGEQRKTVKQKQMAGLGGDTGPAA